MAAELMEFRRTPATITARPVTTSTRPEALSATCGTPRPEWKWLLAITAAVCILVEIPFVIAYAQAFNGRYFNGMFWAPHDFAQFSAAMREGAASSSWLIHDHLSGEPHQPMLMYLPYVALGKVAALFGMDFQVAYHLAEIATRAVLIVSIYTLACEVLSRSAERRGALVLALFAGGLSSTLALIQLLTGFAIPFGASEFTNPEIGSFLSLFTPPHLMLRLALMLLAAQLYAMSWRRSGWPTLVGLSALVFALGLTNSFSLVTICVVVAVHAACMCALYRASVWDAMSRVLAVAIGAALMVAYNALVFANDPFWGATYVAQNILPTPPAHYLAFALGALSLFAMAGAGQFLRNPTPAGTLVLVWVVASIVMMHLPVGVQRRFGFGLHPMLSILAAVAFVQLWKWVRRPRDGSTRLMRPLLTFALVQVLFGATVSYYSFVLSTANDPFRNGGPGIEQATKLSRGTFQDSELRDAGRWLAARMEPTDVVLAEAETGNYLAGVVPGRAFIGHFVATLGFEKKELFLLELYGGRAEPERVRELLRMHRIRYIVYGMHEAQYLDVLEPPPSLGLVAVYVTPGIAIY